MRLVERFAYKHPRFGIPHLMRYLVGGNVMVWLLCLVLKAEIQVKLMGVMAFDAEAILHGELWRLVSFLFIPISGRSLLALLAFYFYYWMGDMLEQYWGTPHLNIYVLLGWLFTVVFGLLVYLISGNPGGGITAFYLYMSMFFAVATLFPDTQVLLFMIIPIKMKWLAIANAALFVFQMAVNWYDFPVNLLPLVATMNYLVFFGAELWSRRPQKASARTVNFRRESARVRREQRHELYKHKCAVCGRTDVTNPELEFRYCSRCAGYHCFCEEHINNHIHFTE
jgi:hypothetical protein